MLHIWFTCFIRSINLVAPGQAWWLPEQLKAKLSFKKAQPKSQYIINYPYFRKTGAECSPFTVAIGVIAQ